MTNVPRVDAPNLFDAPGMANTLRVMLLAMLASALAISALTLFLGWRHTPQLALMSAASCLVAVVLSRSGRIRSAMLLPLLSITYAILHLAARSDGIQNIGLAILPVLTMLGSLVLTPLTLVFFTAAEILAVVGMLAIRYFVLQAERYSTNDMGDLFIFSLTCATAALVGRLLAGRIEDGFRLVRDSESRYGRIFENVQDVYYEMNIDGILLELNPASAALFGIPREGMIGRPLTSFCENRSEFDALRTAVRADGRVSNHELVIRNSGAALRHVLVNASLQTGPRTGEERVIGSIRDITERKRAEALAKQNLESLGMLASGIAHDFNNLLGSILANSELVLSELPAGSPASEGVESIRNVAKRAADIVGQIMAYAGQEKAVFEPVDLSELLHEMLEFLKVSISKRATLNITLPEKLPAVRANAAQLRQVVLNLITNASEALGEQEGVISVAVMQVQSGPSDSAPNLSRGDYIRLEVSDTGCGMTEEIQAKIFDPFFTTKFAGRGMGLAAMKGIVRSHDGAINVMSVPGQGSRFEILLPCSSEVAREGHNEAVYSTAVASFGGTVLVVEDEDTLRIAVSKMLRQKGFTVIEAANGETGVDLFRTSAPEIDVVLLDLTLPGMSGPEVLGELRRVKPNVKVIITSAYSQERARTTLGGQQPWRYIRKPYQINELTDLLRKSI